MMREQTRNDVAEKLWRDAQRAYLIAESRPDDPSAWRSFRAHLTAFNQYFVGERTVQ